MEHLCPDLTKDEKELALLARNNSETYLAEKLLQCLEVDTMLDDVVAIGDKPTMRDFCKASQDHAKVRPHLAPKIKAYVEKHASGKRGARPKVVSAAGAAKLNTAKGADRWWASVRADDTFLRQWLPPHASVCTDPFNGRFLLCVQGTRKSISWTLRGQEAASIETLRVAWAWHSEVSSLPCPLPL